MPTLMTISHGHPDLSAGGAERASYAIHALIKQGHFENWSSIYVARVPKTAIGHDGEFGLFRGRADEIIVSPPPLDHFFQTSLDVAELYKQLNQLVRRFSPDVVHLHHFAYWGLEVIEYFSERSIPVVVTLHEFMAICHRSGQMLKTNGRLCFKASPSECGQCFPDITSGFFYLREQIFQKSLKKAAALISPSQFLANRVIDWSNQLLNVQIIENPRSRSAYQSPIQRRKWTPGAPLVVGYFGQINPFKGVDVLLEAVTSLIRSNVDIRVRLFGANLEVQDESFRMKIERSISMLGDNIEFFGPYQNSAVLRLMGDCDAIVIPSIWWENSPVVIQEAKDANVPIIGSRHGGIEEKIADYPQGYMFEGGSAVALSATLRKVLADLESCECSDGIYGIVDPGSDTNQEGWRSLCDLYTQIVNKPMKESERDLELRTATSRNQSNSKRKPERKRKDTAAN